MTTGLKGGIFLSLFLPNLAVGIVSIILMLLGRIPYIGILFSLAGVLWTIAAYVLLRVYNELVVGSFYNRANANVPSPSVAYAFSAMGMNVGQQAQASAPAPAPAPVPAAPAAPADDLMDDTELLLLITTAIAAYESVPANGLKVRSIRRAKDARWRRA